MTRAFEYVKENGISTLTSYPYLAFDSRCEKATHPRASVKVTSFQEVARSEKALQAAVGKFC